MKKIVLHSLVLLVTVFAAFIFPKSSLSEYEFQILALIFITLYLKKKFFPVIETQYKGESRLLESMVFTLIILVIVNTSGSTLSPYFFLVYFLLFSLSLILEPVISFIVSLSLVVFFLTDVPKNVGFNYYIPIFSLVFLTPFSVYLGEEYRRSEQFRLKNDQLGQSLTKTKEDTLLFLSLMLKNQIKNIKNSVENFVGDHQLTEIKKTVSKMEKLIDKFEKEV